MGAKLDVPMVLFMLPAMFVIMGGSPFLHLIRTFASMTISRTMSYGYPVEKLVSYDRMMRLFGSMWFMLLALCVAIKIGASLTDPWPSLSVEFLPCQLLHAPGAVDHDSATGKGASGWPTA